MSACLTDWIECDVTNLHFRWLLKFDVTIAIIIIYPNSYDCLNLNIRPYSQTSDRAQTKYFQTTTVFSSKEAPESACRLHITTDNAREYRDSPIPTWFPRVAEFLMGMTIQWGITCKEFFQGVTSYSLILVIDSTFNSSDFGRFKIWPVTGQLETKWNRIPSQAHGQEMKARTCRRKFPTSQSQPRAKPHRRSASSDGET